MLYVQSWAEVSGVATGTVPVKDVAVVAWWMPSDELAVRHARRACTCAWRPSGVWWIDIGQSQVLERP